MSTQRPGSISGSTQEKANARRLIAANSLQNVGDQFVAAKTVLPWLLAHAGTPGFFIALLVPIRESGSMLPQAALTPWVMRHDRRAGIWVAGALGQAITAAIIGLGALVLEGWWLGVCVVLALAGFALARSLCSIASKDVQGRTVAKGRRGRINGTSTMIGGLVAIGVGGAVRLMREHAPDWLLAGLILLAAGLWLIGALVFHRIEEPAHAADDSQRPTGGWVKDMRTLLGGDTDFRNFVILRSLLLVSSLSPAFIVALSQEATALLAGLGSFLVASGLAAVLGGRISGIWSDRSSKSVMTIGAAVASTTLLAVVACYWWAPTGWQPWLYPLLFFVVSLAHTAIRVARKTYIVDMAEGDVRTRYVAVANTAMGFILLFTGVISGLFAHFGAQWALVFLAALGFIGVVFSRGIADVSATS
ncbi:Major Facilitator Superfamily protein [Corynebacterium ciconiae DSM 44920]|uniref:MFS transporter n=1 Tax=Corynebacterium ciconiae TaxID=227319 RepID=UPI00036CBB67|nr:MFS transporter [Corynebacterium ciconiae]WKD61572.1 Major Facilitator Superfamily protein [Corynebacterium ciconiae DSM 44920]